MKPPSPGASFLSSNHSSKQEELLYLQTAAPDHAEPRRLPRAPPTLRATPGPPPALTDPRAWRRCRARPAPRDCAAVRGWRCAPSPAGPGPGPAAGQTLRAEPGQGGIAARPGHPPPAQRPRSSAGNPEAAVPPSPRLPPAGDPPARPPLGAQSRGCPAGPERYLQPSASSSSSAVASALPAPRAGTPPHAGRAPPRLRAIGWRGCQSKGAGRGAPAVSRNMAALPPHPPSPHDPLGPIPSLSPAQPRASAAPTAPFFLGMVTKK